jgi:hypothetical protein
MTNYSRASFLKLSALAVVPYRWLGAPVTAHKPGGGGGSQPDLMLHSFLYATTPAGPFGRGDKAVMANTHEYGNTIVEYSAAMNAQSITTQVTNAATQKVIGGFYVIGDGDLPSVPANLAAQMAGYGANPADVWDVTYSSLVFEVVTGTDAGKYAYVGFDTSIAHPLSGFVRAGSDFHANDVADWIQRAGDITLVRDRIGWKVPNVGFVTVSLAVTVDFFYPE